MHTTPTLQVEVNLVRTHGLDQYQATLILDDTVLYTATRWSEAHAVAEAIRWANNHRGST